MISIRCQRIDQSFDLESGTIHNYLVLVLPDGKEVRAEIDSDSVGAILQEAAGGTSSPTIKSGEAPPVSTAGLKPAAEVSKAEPVEEPALPPIHWSTLPDEQLSPLMKLALHRLGLPEMVAIDRLQAIVDQIADQFTQADWDELTQSASPAEPVLAVPRPSAPTPPAPVKPPLKQVTWADGQAIMPQARPPRTVPKDDKGYPIVSHTGVSAQELLGGGGTAVDEDGARQA